MSLDGLFLIAPSVFSNVYLNGDGHQMNQYQTNHFHILTEITEHTNDHDMCRWKSRFWPGSDTPLWRGQTD